MIHILIGTKGQLIKMAPIMEQLQNKDIDYNFINAAQHVKIFDDLVKLFGIKKPNYTLSNSGKDITNSKEIMLWFFKNIMRYGLLNRKDIFRLKNRDSSRDIILIHGDAPPALLGLILGKMKKIKVAHIEAGERTFKLLEPFPEELIRVIVDKYSDIMFASSDESYANIRTKKGHKYNLKYNTIVDSVRDALKSRKTSGNNNYVLFSIHRFETISSKERLTFVVNLAESISKSKRIVFPLHESTRKKLESFDLMKKLESNKEIKIGGLVNYFTFIHLIKNCNYMVTDGGGPQQETNYIGTPCMLLRNATERLGYKNVFMTGFDKRKTEFFMKNYKKYMLNPNVPNTSPSKKIVDILMENGAADEN